ncbi:MAG: class I SAM-dependent methyltransferase [Candidatus Curtissbacteria bacterium]|nr:class I SAM-dependent methyltransferase [Candidatus Curtissbacteria bacterium]MDZ4209628.1 class I SAM-dependent methyltransferase [Candidatus Curtissbacteria bacterium]
MPKETIVDIGCGQKNNLWLYGFYEEPTVGVDFCREFLQRRAGDGNLVTGDSANLPLVSNCADKVFVIHVLEHVDALSGTLDEIGRVLKSGGELTVAVPHKRFERVMGSIDPDYHGPNMHLRIVKEEDLTEELQSRDFEIEEVKTRGFWGAAYITAASFLHLKILKDRKMEAQSGYLVKGDDGQITEGVRGETGKMLKFARSFLTKNPIFSILDKVYPFETYVRAVKR